jgi:hypothetical protein
VTDAAESSGFQGKRSSGNIHTHPTNDDWDYFLLSEHQSKIIYAFHGFSDQKIGLR